MNRLWSQPRSVVMVVACCALWGCGNTGSNLLTDGGSLSDVVGGGGQGDVGQTVPEVGVARTRVRNESVARQVDVTVRFIRDDIVVHLAFIRVLPETATTVLSSHLVDTVEVFGNDSDGVALEMASFKFGRDFNEQNIIEYIIFDDHVDIERPTTPIDQAEPPVVVVPVAPSTITLIEPAQDVSGVIGSRVFVRWADFTELPNTVVRLFLRSVSGGDLISVGPAIGAALDGINDEFRIVLSNVSPGVYELVAEIDDGVALVTSVAPGLISIRNPSVGGNRPPFLTIAIVGGPGVVVLDPDDLLEVTWEDSDPDDNATIIFTLEPSTPGLGAFQISPPFAEDRDGPAADRALLSVRDVLAGLYDLVGTISDGSLMGVARLPRAVLVRQPTEQQNTTPTITVHEPLEDFDTWAGSSFKVVWEDEDPDNDARITLFLDPYPFSPGYDGNEFVLFDSISEDGSGDEIWIGITDLVPVGEYQLGARISDGIAEQESHAPGLVIVVDPPEDKDDVEEPPTEGPPDGPLTIDPVSPPVGPVSSRSISLLIPVAAERVPGIPERVTLSNVPHGGDTTVTFVPDEWSVERKNVMRVSMPASLISNRDWPRKFDALMELSGGVSFTAGPQNVPFVWLPQHAELLGVAAEGFTCGDNGELLADRARFEGFEVSFFGGGLSEEAPGAQVEIWLSSNGVVPPNGAEDATHRLLWVGAGSPNAERTVRVDLATAYAGRDELLTPADGSNVSPPELEAGTYHVVAVADFMDYGRSIAPAYPMTVELCSTDEPARSIASPPAP